jgi:hypothetical protein
MVRHLSEAQMERPGRRALSRTIAGLVAALSSAAGAAPAGLERLVFVRHGEKPAGNFGQLSCQGLNRSLALPSVLIARYGKPDYIFAPDPKQLATNAHRSKYDYLRPVATIEPTAIQLGMPVNTQYDTEQSDALARDLQTQPYSRALVFVAWQHTLIVQMARTLLENNGGDPKLVPDWSEDDFDSIFVVEVSRSEGKTTAQFHIEHEGLDGQSNLCPGQKPTQEKKTESPR